MPTPPQLRAARNRLGLTQAAAGQLIGRSADYWRRRETGELPISPGDCDLFISRAVSCVSIGQLQELLTDGGIPAQFARAKQIYDGADMTPEEQSAFCWALFNNS